MLVAADDDYLKMNDLISRLGVLAGLVLVGFLGTSCARLLPHRTGEVRSTDMVLDTRREPALPLSGCFIPAVFPAVTRLPVEFLDPVPAGAMFQSAKVEVILKNGEMKVLEAAIENNKVYLKFAVPAADSFSQYNVFVVAKYTSPPP